MTGSGTRSSTETLSPVRSTAFGSVGCRLRKARIASFGPVTRMQSIFRGNSSDIDPSLDVRVLPLASVYRGAALCQEFVSRPVRACHIVDHGREAGGACRVSGGQ